MQYGKVANGLGSLYTMRSLVIGLVLALILFIVGVYLATKKYVPFTPVRANVIQASKCSKSIMEHTSKDSTQISEIFTCNLDVQYIVNEKTYKTHLTTSSPFQYSIGDSIRIEYDPSNPSDVRLPESNPHSVGVILIVLSLLIGAGSVGFFRYMGTHKEARRIFGVGSAARNTVSLFRK